MCIHLAKTSQAKKFLLSTDRPLGEVRSATVTFGRDTDHHSERHHKTPHIIIEKIEVNYLYPLPKKLTSSQLCRISEAHDSHGRKRFVFRLAPATSVFLHQIRLVPIQLLLLHLAFA
ncbi:hypothetical protein CEXT_86251 [Caerostris extrusa]|uniref:Uncharacterized protein n=1 Tax=Caerostris extrusa TaxID=172846 RepID=A0AAV4XGC7_CAEEX|nr:hypothetical protein CEXT_86251 [Caerostris extrusa]